MSLNATPAERIARHIRVDESGCWRWTGWCDKAGYARIRIDRIYRPAHRVSYEAHVGPIPEGLHIDHLCRVRDCVNPDHLEAVTPTVNTLRSFCPAAINARKTHCNRGHELAGDNLKVDPDGHRRCRECRRLMENARWESRKARRQAARLAAKERAA